MYANGCYFYGNMKNGIDAAHYWGVCVCVFLK